MKIDIIGAGIGGLTAAIALERKGVLSRISEQAEYIKPVGAGIILASNAMQVFEKLGLRETIEKKGNFISSINITKTNLKPLSKVDLTYFEEKHNVKNIAIHRGVLQQILVDALQTSSLHLGQEMKQIHKTTNGYLLEFAKGEKRETNVLIGADGLKSQVRRQIFETNTLRNAGQICWRGVADFNLPEEYQSELNEVWGKNERFGFVQIAENKVYWYALKSLTKDKAIVKVDDVKHQFHNCHRLVSDIISTTTSEQIHIAEIWDLKPIHQWHKDNICLIGDAAHATTPNMGQGACQAIEDAFVLSECLHKYDIKRAFEEFQKLRLPKAHQVVKASWNIGKIAHISNSLLVMMRNQMIRMTPESINRKQFEHIYQIPNL